jgi:predicted amidohydrolase
MFEKVGVFHFPTGHTAPIPALEDKSTRSGVRISLIALPEAFNNGDAYVADKPPRIPAEQMLRELSAIAKLHNLVFAAGLLDQVEGKIRNAAYLIDGSGSRLMVHKGAKDDIENPIETEGVCVGCLICSDAYDERRHRVTQKMEKSVLARKVVCIPASMSANTFEGPPRHPGIRRQVRAPGQWKAALPSRNREFHRQ